MQTVKTRVIVVDPHAFVRRALAAMLDAEPDLECCGQWSLAEADVAAIRRRRPDVILVDVSSREGEGLKLIGRIRAARLPVRIVATAMYSDECLASRVAGAGAAGVVIKSDMADRVLAAIRRLRSLPVATRAFAPAAASGLNGHAGGPEALDELERRVVELTGRGMPACMIAVRLGLSLAEVAACQRRIRRRLCLPNPVELVQFCVRWVQEHSRPSSLAH